MDIIARLQGIKRTGDGWTSRCPAHEDKNRSFRVGHRDGKWLLKSNAGCDWTGFDEIAPRLQHYVFMLRRAGFSIATEDEHYGGAFADTHGRYVLISPVRLVEDTAT